MFHSHDSITAQLDADEARQRSVPRTTPVPVVGMVTLDLDRGDSAWHPASTKRDLHGPIRLTYRRYPDGGVEVEASRLPVAEVAR